MSIKRAVSIAKARKYIREGVSGAEWIREMRAAGLGYRTTDMRADYRNVLHIEKKEGVMRFVRKDRYPSTKAMATVTWETSKEYMYKAKVFSVTRAGIPETERFVNIMSDVPMTPEMVEAEVEKQWGEWERYSAEEIKKIQSWTAVRSVME